MLGSRAIITLSSLWSGAQHRNPYINGYFVPWHEKPEKSAFRSGEVAVDTGYRLSRFKGTQGVEVVGKKYVIPGTRKEPDIAGLCAGKKPAFVSFDDAGYDDRSFFTVSIALAAQLVASGYYGVAWCCSDAIKYMSENPERCTVFIGEDGLLTVRICWGEEKMVGPLLDFCRAERFTEEEGWEEYEKPRKTA